MHENSKYETDIRYTIQVTRAVMTVVGLWPASGPVSRRKHLLKKLINVSCQFLMYFILIPGLLKMFLKETNPRRRLKLLGPMCNCTIALSKYMILLLRSEAVRGCLRHIEVDWMKVGLSERKTMLDYAKIGRRLGILSVAFVYGSGFSFRIFVPIAKGTIVTPDNVTIRPMPYPGYFVFFDPQISPAYETVFSLQFITGFVKNTVASGTYSLAAVFALHGCGQLKILMTRLEDLAEGQMTEGANTVKRLSVVVQHHMRVKSFLGEVEDVLQQLCLVEVVGCTLILCLLGYYVIMEWENSDAVSMVTYGILLATFLFNIFILCFIGEFLNDQGLKVYLTTCTLNWYRMPNKTARSLVLIIAMSNLPIKITAGKFLDLSLNSFGAIVRTSVAYLNMLRTTT